MQIKIKKERGFLTIEYTSDTSKPPMKVELNQVQAAALVQVIQMAVKSEKFAFEFKD